MSQTRWDSDSNQVPFISLPEAEGTIIGYKKIIKLDEQFTIYI